MRVRTKLLIIGLLLSLVPIGIVGFVSIRIGKEAIVENLGSRFKLTARATIIEVDRVLFSIQQDATAWSANPIMQEVLSRDIDARVSAKLIKLHRNYPQLASITVFDIGGEVIAASPPYSIGNKVNVSQYESAYAGSRQIRDGHVDPVSNTLVVSFAFPLFAQKDAHRVIFTLSNQTTVNTGPETKGDNGGTGILGSVSTGPTLISLKSDSFGVRVNFHF